MPIYDYACSACGQVTEVIHGIHDGGPRFCPACGAEGSMRKALSTPAIVFKGSGWAKVDRRSSGGSGARSTGSPSKPSEASTGAAADGSSPAGATPGGAASSGQGGGTSAATRDAPKPSGGRASSERGAD